MKKLLVGLLSASLVLGLTGCGAAEVTKEIIEQKESLQKEVETLSAVVEKAGQELSSGLEQASEQLSSGLEQASSELESASSDMANNTGDSKTAFEAKALIKTLAPLMRQPDNYHMIMEMNAKAVGMSMKMETYRHGESFKSGIDYNNSGVMNYSIYDAETGYQYNYTEGESTGTKFKVENNDIINEEIFEMPDFSKEEFDDEDFEGIEEARTETLDGIEVLYIRSRVEDEGAMKTEEMWISVEHGFPQKMILTDAAGNVEVEMNMLEMEMAKSFAKDIKPPTNVEFTEN